MRDGGLAKLCSLMNTSLDGQMPVEKLVFVQNEFYSYRTAGVTRLYAALSANRSFDKLVRLWNCQALPDGVAYVVLEDGEQYRIDRADQIIDEDALDLTLVRLEDHYDVTTETIQSV